MHFLARKGCLVLVFLIFTGSALSCFAASDFGPVDMGAFYTALPPFDPQAKLGSLVKAEKITTTVPGAQAWKIAYVSSDVNGNKTLVTGVVAAPTGPIPRSGRPIMAWAHGTTGTAQTCGPSQILNPAQPLNQYFLMTGTSWTDFGLPAMEAFMKAGYVIVATDYQGLGGGGKHQYTVAATQARDVIDSIRAATQLKAAGAGMQAIVYGWSQGGGATIAAASLPDYINATDTARDGIKIVGFVAMAPFDIAVTLPEHLQTEAEATAYLQKLGATFGKNVFNFAHYVENIWGMTAAFPALKLEDIFTPDGAQAINELAQRKCVHVMADTLNFTYGAHYKNLLRSDIKNALVWVAANKKSGVKPVKPIAPVIIYWGTQDTTVPPIMGQLYYEQMCQLGGDVTRVQLPGQQTHFSTPGSAEPLYISWIADRFAGKPSPNGCRAI